MWGRSIKALGLALLCGLCAGAQANTTAADRPRLAQIPGADALPPLQLDAPAADQAAPPSPAAPMIRMALLLPLRSATLGAAAQAVRGGFLAGHEREPAGVTVAVLESGEAPQDVLPAYAAASGQFDIVIGPLSRFDVAAVAQSGQVSRSTIALAQPQTRSSQGDEDEVALPPRMLVVGLSLEEEARQVANWIGALQPGAKVFVVSANTAWQQRTARAFAAQARQVGLTPQSMALSLAGGALSPSGLAQLKQRIAAEQPEALFVALDAPQAGQVRAAIGDAVALYGTSQLNPLTPADWLTAAAVNEMNGARFVDIPWQLQPDHPAVMVYPHPVVEAGQQRSADLERLYALGIDAYRVAREIAVGRTHFEIDGVTGKLVVSVSNGASAFQRTETQAIYRDGKVQPLAGP